MKIQHLIPILFLAAFCTVSAQTTNTNTPALLTTNQVTSPAGSVCKQEIAKMISDVLTEYEKIKPGMTHAALTNLFVGVQMNGLVPFGMFEQHQTFLYRVCANIQIDVDFAPSESKQERLTDTIEKISRLYLGWIPVTD